jgi:streptolysin S family bacteriocin protoxin
MALALELLTDAVAVGGFCCCFAACIISFSDGEGRSLAMNGLFLLAAAAVAAEPIRKGFVAA